MTAREIADLFAGLELQLIRSLKRNLAAHRSQEDAEGGKDGVPEHWPAWQAEKLRSLDAFRRENRAVMSEYSSRIDAETRAMLKAQFAEADGSEQAFFGVNRDKLDALIGEMRKNEAQTEKAALRYMDDVYRKTILRAGAALAAGGMTMQQAVDMSVQDFLEKGINCIRYRDGRRVNIASYAEMALRTSGTRAMLLGEAQKRERLGVDTVLVSQYGACSETCLPWQGLVYIDDVWQPYRGGGKNPGGTYGHSRNGHSYPLLSVAVKAGLFHPSCRHTLTTWIEGESRRPEPMGKAQVERTAKLEAKQRSLERQVRRYKRLTEGTQAPEKTAEYKARVRGAQKRLREFVAEHGDVLRRDYWRERNDGTFTMGYEHDIIQTRGGSVGLDVTIDGFTPCLEEAKTGRILATTYERATADELLNLKGWAFDWTSSDLAECEIYKLTLEGESEIQGLVAISDMPRSNAVYVNLAESAPHNLGNNKKYIGVGGHLFAIAARRSYDLGHSCFLCMDAKNKELVQHYSQLLNAKLLGRPHPYRMYVDEENAFALIEKYSLKGDR